MLLKIQRIDPVKNANIPLPKRATPKAAGWDLYSNIDEIVIANNGRKIITTGLRFQIPPGWEIQIRSRSGLASKGIIVANSPGTVDENYRGEIKVILLNTSTTDFYVTRGIRIAQIVPKLVPHITIQEVEYIDTNTERGTGGFGSTGLYNGQIKSTAQDFKSIGSSGLYNGQIE